MKHILWLVLVLAPLTAWATRMEMPEYDGSVFQCLKSAGTYGRPFWDDCNAIRSWDEIKPSEGSDTFQPPNGAYIIICTGCTKTNPCAEGEDSDTALAFWERDHWSCNPTETTSTTVTTTTETTTTEESTTTTETTTTTTTTT